MLGDTWVLETWTGPATLDLICDGLERLWAFHPHVPDRVRMQIGIAVAEIGANIVEHAGRHRPVRMRMSVQVGADQVNVHFADDGGPAHVDLRSVSTPDVWSEHGRGLAMAQEVLERLRYHRSSFNNWMLSSMRFSSA